ncbi:MAG TPA: hypothetical protein VFW26_09135 [Gaiellales bacterium]|nr:hypothetical protein [Gaiellales bacterium]
MTRKPPADNDARRWRLEAERLRPLEDAHVALAIQGVKEYLSALGALHHAAHYPLKRGVEFDHAYRTDLHGRTKTSGAGIGRRYRRGVAAVATQHAAAT